MIFFSSARNRQFLHARARHAGDQPRGALEREVIPQPRNRDHEAVAEADQVIDVRDAPHQPREEALQPEAAHLNDRALAPDGGERTDSPDSGTAGASRPSAARAAASPHRCPAASRPARRRAADCRLASSSAAVSPMTKTSRMPRHRKVRRDLHAARAIGLDTEPLARGRGHHAGRPHHRARLDACRFRSLADRHARVVERGHSRAEPHLHAKLFERGSGGLRERRIERREQARRRLHQDDARGARVDRAEVLGKRAVCQLGDRAGHLDAGRAAADDHEIQQPRALGRVGLGLGLLEGEQDAAADVGRVVDGLQPRALSGPFAVTEIGVLRAGRENQDVVGNAPAFGENLAPLRCR